MRKFFLLTAALVATTASFAQKVANVDKTAKMAQSVQAVRVASEGEPVKVLANGMVTTAPVQKSVATGLYYNRPEGSFYQGFDFDGNGYYNTDVIVTPFKDFTIKNMSTDKSGIKWLLKYPQVNAAGTAYESYTEYDVTKDVDAEGNYTTSINPGYYSPAPNIVRGTDQFTLGETNQYWKGDWNTNIGRNSRIRVRDAVSAMCASDPHVGNYYGTGSLSTQYFWGTGTLNNSTYGLGTCFGVRQTYEKPMSPLYVERIFIQCLSTSATPIAAGKELTMFIVDNTDPQNPVIKETIKATAEDISGLAKGPSSFASAFKLAFTNKVETAFGEAVAPFTIDYPFFVQVEGLDQEGVDVGFYGHDIADGDNVANGNFLVKYSERNGSHYYTGLALPFTFESLFDAINVWDNVQVSETQTIENCNVLKVSADGKTVTNEALSSYGINGAVVQTACDWTDTDGNENYFKTEDSPEWVAISATYNEANEAYFINVTCDALPAGQAGRYGELRIEGRGIVSDPIIIMQGDVSGITDITADKADKANAGIYNLAGQRVSKNAKGLLIVDGKKVIK